MLVDKILVAEQCVKEQTQFLPLLGQTDAQKFYFAHGPIEYE